MGITKRDCDDPSLYDEMDDDKRHIMREWIRSQSPLVLCSDYRSSYGFKHDFERTNGGFYVTNGQFKGAMLDCGYSPRDVNERNWKFRALRGAPPRVDGSKPRIIKEFRTWAVTEDGVECLASEYTVAPHRLKELDWISHLENKRWCVIEDFIAAYWWAVENFPFTVSKQHRDAPVGPKQRYRILQRDEFRCQICGRDASDGAKLQVDHIMPRSRGGASEDDNLRTLCFECNIGKSNII